ncbi:hypothetical protein KA517_01590 [Candidatus Gracilibacteria bacterium]|nr:hypothetical protein [Candidatus Gracilibacteria bacterium]
MRTRSQSRNLDQGTTTKRTGGVRAAVFAVLMQACSLQNPILFCTFDATGDSNVLRCNPTDANPINTDDTETGVDGTVATDQPTNPDARDGGSVADDAIDAATDLGSEGIDTGAMVDSTNDAGTPDNGFEAGTDAGQDAQIDITTIEDTSRVDAFTDSPIEASVDAAIDAPQDAAIDRPDTSVSGDTGTVTDRPDVVGDTGTVTDRPDVVDAGTHSDVIIPTDDGSTVAPECREISFGGAVTRDGVNYRTVENNYIDLIFTGTPRCTVRSLSFTGTPTRSGAIGLSPSEITTGVATGTFTVPNVQVLGNDVSNGGPFVVSTTVNCFEAGRVINCRDLGVTRSISVRPL